MWQSKKNHTSFVKSFLHHEPEAKSEGLKSKLQFNGEHHPKTNGKNGKAKAKGKALLQDLMETPNLEDDVFLKVLGI
jgi:hypothetical protein